MKKYAMTLLEIMVVIFLIGLISGILGYNIKGGMDKGRAFRSEQGAKLVEDILLLQIAEGDKIEDVVANPVVYLRNSGLVSDPEKTFRDGWGKKFTVEQRGEDGILVFSEALRNYEKKHPSKGRAKVADEASDD